MQGEYVEFELAKMDDDKHEFKASDISGIKDGKLMCETQAENLDLEIELEDLRDLLLLLELK